MGYSLENDPLFTNLVTLCKHFKGPLQKQVENGAIAILLVTHEQKPIITVQLD